MDRVKELKSQVSCALQEANFPITSDVELFAAFPCGPDTTFKVSDKEVKVGDAAKHMKDDHYPFICSDDLAGLMCEIWDENRYI